MKLNQILGWPDVWFILNQEGVHILIIRHLPPVDVESISDR